MSQFSEESSRPNITTTVKVNSVEPIKLFIYELSNNDKIKLLNVLQEESAHNSDLWKKVAWKMGMLSEEEIEVKLMLYYLNFFMYVRYMNHLVKLLTFTFKFFRELRIAFHHQILSHHLQIYLTYLETRLEQLWIYSKFFVCK